MQAINFIKETTPYIAINVHLLFNKINVMRKQSIVVTWSVLKYVFANPFSCKVKFSMLPTSIFGTGDVL